MSRLRLISFLFIFSQLFTAVNAQNIYTIKVNDLLGAVDSAAVTFGDSTKYTDSTGVAVFYNPLVEVNDNPTLPTSFAVSNAYPNPTEGNEIHIGVSSAKETEMEFKVYDIAGKLVSKGKTYLNAGAYSLNVKGVKNLSSGVYFIRVSDGDKTYARKFVNLNNGSGGALRFNVSDFNGGSFAPEGKKDTYIALHIEKEGYFDYDAQVEPSESYVEVNLEREGKTLAGKVYDNESFEPIDAIGVLYYNGNEVSFTTTNGFFDVQAPHSVNMIDSLKVWNDSTFIQTYKNIPFEGDITNVGLFVTSYKNLNVTPELFYDFVMEVATELNPHGDHIVSIDFQNASRDYTYWIDKDAAYTYVDSTAYDTLSNEEQQHIADVITERFYSHMQDTTHMPKFYFAQSGEIPPLRPEGGFVYGTIFVTHMRGGNGYGYSDANYGDDYLLDASEVSIGDPTDNDGATAQEVASIISSRTGSQNQEIGGQSIFSEVNPTAYMTGIDIKLLKIEENILHDLDNPTITPIQEYTMPNGEVIQRFYYPTGVEVKDVLGKQRK